MNYTVAPSTFHISIGVAMLFLVLVIAALCLLFLSERYITTQLRPRGLAAKAACFSPPRLNSKYSLGIRMLLQSFFALREKRYLHLSAARFAKHGPTFAYSQLGTPEIQTIEPENIQAILSTQFEDFEFGNRRARAMEPLIGHGIFTADGKEWRDARDLIRPLFRGGQMDNLEVMEPHVRNLLACVPQDGSTFDLAALLKDVTMDVATECLFGESTALLRRDKATSWGEDFSRAFDRGQSDVIRAFALGPFVSWLVGGSQCKQDRKMVHDCISKYMSTKLIGKRREETSKARYSFVEELYKRIDNTEHIRGQLLNVLLAGRDTTASLITSLFFELSRKKDLYQRLRAEILQTRTNSLPKDGFTVPQLRSTSLLRACLNEVLRLYPPVPRNFRFAVRDTTLPRGGGPDGKSPIFIAKGTMVNYQTFAMHRRTDIWGANAAEFVPERWMRENVHPRWAFVPFSGGPRVCLGRSFALNQVMYVTARFIETFESLEAVNESENWVEELGMTCTTKSGNMVRVSREEC